MARDYTFYGKKRGNRRTGSDKAGTFGLGVFFAIFFLIGCGGAVVIVATLIFPEFQANRRFVAHTCVVLQKRIAEKPSEDGMSYRPEFLIAYELKGKKYQVWTYDVAGVYSSGRADKEAVLEQFTVGQEYPCWYAPWNPTTAVLVLGYTWWFWLVLLVPLSFTAIGGGGLIYLMLNWGKSAERRAVMAQRAAKLDPFEAAKPNHPYPNVPGDADLVNSPGTTLAYRLPIGKSPAWVLLVSLIVCVVWNGVVSFGVVWAVNGHRAGDPDWFLTLFLIPFVLVGLGTIWFFLRQLLITTGIGPTRIEISDHPLRPGQQYQILLSQMGRLTMNSLEVLLACEEAATYRQGTDTRTETRRVFKQQVFRREGFEIREGLPFETPCQIEVPAGAMHSFKSEHNKIAWQLVVKGDVAGWPDFERTFPVVVYPADDGGSEA